MKKQTTKIAETVIETETVLAETNTIIPTTETEITEMTIPELDSEITTETTETVIPEITVPETTIPEIKIEIPVTAELSKVKESKPVVVVDEVAVEMELKSVFDSENPISTLGLAKVLKKLTTLGLNMTQAASRCKKSYVYSRKLISLTSATPATLQLVEENKVSAWSVIEALSIKESTVEIVEKQMISLANANAAHNAAKAEATNKPTKTVKFSKEEVEAMLKAMQNNILTLLTNDEDKVKVADYKFEITSKI